jgi:hypothetical protein
MKAIVFMLAFTAAGCTDAGISRITSFGSAAHVTCYSGGKPIYDGCSTGKVISEEGSDGYFFTDKKDRLLREVSGECVIVYGADC